MVEGVAAMGYSETHSKGRRFYAPDCSCSSAAAKRSQSPLSFGPCFAYSLPSVHGRVPWPFWFETVRPEPCVYPRFDKVQLHSLNHLLLARPIDVVVERDGDGFMAKTPEVPEVYGFGDGASDAIDSLKREIESLHRDLEEDDNFTPDWLQVKAFLRSLVLESRR